MDESAGSVRRLASKHRLLPATEPVAQARGRCHLVAVGLPRWRSNVVTRAQRQCKRGLQPPLILHIELVFVDRKSPINWISLGRRRPSLVKIIVCGDLADGTQELGETVTEGSPAASI